MKTDEGDRLILFLKRSGLPVRERAEIHNGYPHLTFTITPLPPSLPTPLILHKYRGSYTMEKNDTDEPEKKRKVRRD